MRGGDISNEVPPRVVVTLDCVIDKKPNVRKFLGIPILEEEITYNRQSLSMFWRFSQKYGYVLELAGFGYSKKEMRAIQEDLDNLGTNPFNYYTAYRTVADLVREMPYRPELAGVVDVPDRALRYGSKYIDTRRMI